MILISLFSGIGGFELAAEWMGWQVGASCEINPFGQKILKYHFPKAYHHDDIHTLTYEKINQELTERFGQDWRSNGVILSGGFPCQPYSMAGKRLGKEDDRHLWPEMLRIIREVKPDWIVGENVLGIVSWNGGLVFNEVQVDLETERYEVQPFVLPAAAVNAPHRRDRVWFVAYSNGYSEGSSGESCSSERIGSQNNEEQNQWGGASEQHIGCTDVSRIASDTESRWSGRIRNESKETGASESNQSLGGFCGVSSASDTSNNRLEHTNEQQCERKLFEEPKRKRIDSNTFCAKSIEANGSRWDAADTDGVRQSGKEYRKTQPEQYLQNSKRPNWNNFPTQSPICSRNDGLPAELDGITFSKWRNESIKAGGNAIVPQVAFQIFKAIDAYESLH